MPEIRTPPEQLQFHLETDGIEAKALVRILQDTHLAFREIGVANSASETELKIFPFKQGSFEYAIGVIAALNTAAAALGTFREIISYKKAKLEYLKAQKENLSDAKPMQNLKPEIPATLQNNPTINIYINGMLKTIGDNSDGFTLSDPTTNKTNVRFSKDEIREVLESEKGSKETPERKTIVLTNEKLSLKVISHKAYGKWDFVYDGIRIKAEVPDSLKKGAQFHNYKPGTILYVTLSIRQEYNNIAKAWENIAYRITEIHSIDVIS